MMSTETSTLEHAAVDGYALNSIEKLVLTRLSVPTASYEDEPSKTIVIDLTLQPRVVITCSTLSGYELGYFGWDKGAVEFAFEGDDEVVISYSTKPTIWSSGQRVPQTREFLAERGWFHTFANVVTREGVIGDGGGIMRLSVRSLADHAGAGARDTADAKGEEQGIHYTIVGDSRATADAGEYEDEEDEDMSNGDEAEGSRLSPSRTPRLPGRDKKRVRNGKIGKIGKVKSGPSGTVKKIINPFANLTISK